MRQGSSVQVGLALAFGVGAAVLAPPAPEGSDGAAIEARPVAPGGGLRAAWTARELRETVPIARRDGRKTRSVLSLGLPRIERGDRIRVNGEVTLSTTCVEAGLPRCIGRRYGFDPHLHARVVLARHARTMGGGTLPASRRVGLTCQQTRPNRNHHCPLVVGRGSISVKRLRDLPCRPRACRLNMLVDAHHRRARGGEVVLVGADKPDGSIKGGLARLNASIASDGANVTSVDRRTTRRRTRTLPASFDGGYQVVYSQRMNGLRAGDVLLVRAGQRTAIERYAYFIANRVVIATRPGARWPGRLTRRIVSPAGMATGTNGFNCTLGPSAFRSPCLRRKAGLAFIERTPSDRRGGIRPLYVNLVSRGFPKLIQAAGGAYPPARLLSGGGLTVRRLRAEQTEASDRP
jgi:hypothetical protein